MTETIIDLIQAARNLGIDLKAGYQTCPFCLRPKKFRVTGNRFRCYHPECGKQGDIIDLVKLHLKVSTAEAFSLLRQQSDQPNYSGWLERLNLLERVFDTYSQAVDDRCLAFLNSRGYGFCLEEIKFGFAPHSKFLQEQGFSLAQLVEQGLAYKSGDEFFHERVIFGIYDFKGRLVHMQGRALDPDVEVRWLSTPSNLNGRAIAPITNYLFEGHRYAGREQIEWLFLSEGISDGLSIIELEAEVVSCFGVEVNLCRFVNLFQRVRNLVVVLDNDRYPLMTPLAGLYKSWTPMLESLVELQVELPQLRIWCAPPPATDGIKDVNDWLNVQALTPTDFTQKLKPQLQPLFQFTLSSFKERPRYHPLLIKLLKIHPSKAKQQQFRNLIPDDPVPYLMEVLDAF